MSCAVNGPGGTMRIDVDARTRGCDIIEEYLRTAGVSVNGGYRLFSEGVPVRLDESVLKYDGQTLHMILQYPIPCAGGLRNFLRRLL